MKNMKKITTFALGALMAFSAFGFVGCGGGTKTGDTEITVGILNNSSERENYMYGCNLLLRRRSRHAWSIHVCRICRCTSRLNAD